MSVRGKRAWGLVMPPGGSIRPDTRTNPGLFRRSLMSHANTAFAFSDPAEPQVLAAARALAARLAADQAISRLTMNATMADHFGGSDAEGRWSVRAAHAALELAQVMFLAQATDFSPAMSSSRSKERRSGKE